MKVLFLTRRYYPDIGGVEKHIWSLNKQLLKQVSSLTVIAEVSQLDSIQAKKGNKFVSDGVEVYKINAGKDRWIKKFIIWRELWRLRNVIQHADVVHCHDVFFWYLPFRIIFPSKPVYITFHGYESYPIKKKAVFVRKISEKLSWGNICIGDFIEKWYGTKPTFVSYGAVEMILKKQKEKIKQESALFFGRLDDQTGILTYLKAWQKIKKHFTSFKFLVVGEGVYKNKISKEIKYLGFQKNPEQYFSTYRFAFLSRYLSILEAFAAKRLVFAVYDNPVKEDYLKMAPFAKYIIITDNAEEIATKIKYFIEHPDQEKKLVNQAYQWVQKQTWFNMAELYLSLWKKNSK